MANKRKIFNDPVYGFVSIPSDLIFDLIEHPSFQRLRRIKQMGTADYVYPGALHTRFHHALGAMHLMGEAIKVLQSKGIAISEKEKESAQIAILLHDIGHGPFSHVLEHTLLHQVHHEHISALLMQFLNKYFDGQLTIAIEMFNGTYPRAFFHQLISSQLDMDRMDYLCRDTFFSGVVEGQIGVDRIIKMLNVVENQLVIEEKGLLSVEDFLHARRLMYWQAYLHKTSICTEVMLVQIIKRARELLKNGQSIFSTPSFQVFLSENVNLSNFQTNPLYLEKFIEIDDSDIWACIKVWQHHEDALLSTLCKDLLHRNLYKIILSNEPIQEETINSLKHDLLAKPNINATTLPYLIIEGSVSNKGYVSNQESIKILRKNNEIIDIAEASDLPTIKALMNIVKKYYVCWGKNVSL